MSDPEDHFERVNPLWRSVFTGEVKKLQRGRAFFRGRDDYKIGIRLVRRALEYIHGLGF